MSAGRGRGVNARLELFVIFTKRGEMVGGVGRQAKGVLYTRI